ncbi:MAG: hypothetical protein ACRDCE_22965 [Cetobacterium sp.]|uniref:hypothetical protein n=1 Tax=Cetobacterium sp. TaxID=2071632 RepID=UPI003EE5EDF5
MFVFDNDQLKKSFTFTQIQVLSAYHSGDCQEGATTVANEMADQFADVADSDLIAYLEHYCIDDANTKTRADLIMYAVWLMAADIQEDPYYEYDENEDPMGLLPMMQPIIDKALDKVITK